MNESLSENRYENLEKMDPKNLSFEELEKLSKEVTELAKSSFKETENGFININGDGLIVIETSGIFKIGSVSSGLADFHRYILHGPNKILEKGCDSKEEIMLAIKKMIEELGNRIIE